MTRLMVRLRETGEYINQSINQTIHSYTVIYPQPQGKQTYSITPRLVSMISAFPCCIGRTSIQTNSRANRKYIKWTIRQPKQKIQKRHPVISCNLSLCCLSSRFTHVVELCCCYCLLRFIMFLFHSQNYSFLCDRTITDLQIYSCS